MVQHQAPYSAVLVNHEAYVLCNKMCPLLDCAEMAEIVRMRSVGSAIREAAGRCPPAGSQDDSYNARLAWLRTLGVPEETRLIRSALKVAHLFAAHTYRVQPSRGSFEEAYGEVVVVLRELFDAAHELGPGGWQGEAGQGPGQDFVNLSQIICTVRGDWDGFFM